MDAVVSPNELLSTARRWALDILERKKPWVVSYYKTDKLEPLGEAREILNFARAQARRQAPNLRHPLVCIDVVEEGIVNGPRAGLWKVRFCFNSQFLEFEQGKFTVIMLISYLGRKLRSSRVL